MTEDSNQYRIFYIGRLGQFLDILWETACTPTMTVLQRLQTTIAHEMKNGHTPHRSGCDVARTPQSTPVDMTQFSANDVFIRPIEHYADDGDTGLVNDVFPYGTHTSQEGGNL
ncbi:hypothetical protein HMPREF0293_0582, partial [Corynebacterium glucuronolyticum ATCC 51866]